MMDLGTIWFFIIPFALTSRLPGPAQGALVAQVLTRSSAASVPFLIGMVAGEMPSGLRHLRPIGPGSPVRAGVHRRSNGSASPTCCSWHGSCGTRPLALPRPEI